MKDIFARNILRFRKEKGLTQEDLAQRLGISFQAISKWENAQTMPDIMIVPTIANILHVSVDQLLGYAAPHQQTTIYETEYETSEYYWGIEPNEACFDVLRAMPPITPLKLLDVGCGEGKDAVFFARNGYQVTAFDISNAGLDKGKRLADRIGVQVNWFKADLLDYRLDSYYDIIFSSGVLHYIRPDLRHTIFTNYKQYTTVNGLHAFNVFVHKPFIAPPPENEPNAHTWLSGELSTLYYDWQLINNEEVIFDCLSSGIPHQHAMSKLLARKRV